MRFLAGVLVGLTGLGCAIGSPIPAEWADVVIAARETLLREDDDVTASYGFRTIRCRADGGLLVIFDRGSLFGPAGYGYAMQGPGGTDWGGGLGAGELPAEDPEIEQFFSESPEGPCPVDSAK